MPSDRAGLTTFQLVCHLCHHVVLGKDVDEAARLLIHHARVEHPGTDYSEQQHFWLRCGNCGDLLTSSYPHYLAIEFYEHARNRHTGNVHLPTGGVCDERKPHG